MKTPAQRKLTSFGVTFVLCDDCKDKVFPHGRLTKIDRGQMKVALEVLEVGDGEYGAMDDDPVFCQGQPYDLDYTLEDFADEDGNLQEQRCGFCGEMGFHPPQGSDLEVH